MTTRRLAFLAALVALVALAGGGLLAVRASRSREGVPGSAGPPRAAVPRNARAPEGVRIRVEVLNTTKTHGLARRATQLLRDRGFDVVGTGTTSPARESTLVLDRSRNPQWARLVANAIGAAGVESRPDSSRYLDITVLLGAAWRPPAEPFHP